MPVFTEKIETESSKFSLLKNLSETEQNTQALTH